MNIKNLFLTLGASLALSLGVKTFANKTESAYADGIVDAGTIIVESVRNQASNSWQVYLIPNQENILPHSWDDKYLPVGDDSGIFVNGQKDSSAYIKHADIGITYLTFYVELTNHSTAAKTVTFKGTWQGSVSGTTYQFTFEECVGTWNGSTWTTAPVFETYDKVTLSDAGFEDRDHVSFDTNGLVPSGWNTFITSSENTTNSFSVEFLLETYSKVDKTLTVTVGGTGYQQGHYYQLVLNNSWSDNGVVKFYEFNNNTSYNSGDLQCNILPGNRHTFEFGSVYIKGSSDTFNFVKYDGSQIYGQRKAPLSNERTTRIASEYGLSNIFIGSTATTPKENTQVLRANHYANSSNGVYLDGTINDIPNSWDTKGAPVSKYNLLQNGHPVELARTGNPPMAKPGDGEQNSYFFSFNDAGMTLNNGDYITLCDEYRFYGNNKAYSMNVIPTTMKFIDGEMVHIEDLNDELLNNIENHVNISYYETDKAVEVNAILEEAGTMMISITDVHSLWNQYHDYIEQLDLIPINPEKYAEILAEAKTNAFGELESLLDAELYDEDNYEIVSQIVENSKGLVSAETVIENIKGIIDSAKANIASSAKTRQEVAEEAIMASDEILFEYLECYDTITTTDLSCVGDMVFLNKTGGNSYSSGGFEDTTARFATSQDNPNGNLIFQFEYESTDPNSREYAAQVFIRMRGLDDSECYRFDIGTYAGPTDENSGVALCKFTGDVATSRIVYDSNFEANQSYKIECGCIDLERFDRTLLFIKVEDQLVLKEIVDSFAKQQPTIRIMDSFTTGDNEARLSPIETGTSKSKENSTLLGRLMLDNSSNKNNLYVTLKENSLPSEALLYPTYAGSFTIDGNEIANKRSETNIKKVSDTRYRIEFNSNDLVQDGTTIHIGDYFSYLDGELVKHLYRFFGTEFVYHQATDSWSQTTPTDKETVAEEAKETLNNYVNKADYSTENQQKITAIINEYSALIDAAGVNEIPGILEEALGKLDVIPTILAEAKKAAKDELANYPSGVTYRAEEQAEREQILVDANSRIDAATDQAAINDIVTSAKASIDALKTSEERDAEDLAATKKTGKTTIESLSSKLDMDRYSSENQDKLTDLTHQALAEIEKATSQEEVNSIIARYKESIKAIETNDGSVFDGENYVTKKKSNKTTIIIIVASVGGALLIGGGVAAGILLLKKKRRLSNEKN